MTRGCLHPMRQYGKSPRRSSTEALTSSSFKDLFVKPLKDGYSSIGRGGGSLRVAPGRPCGIA